MAKVLVIDDDPSLLRALRLGLKAGGHDVVTAANGEQGISQTAIHSPDIVVLDLGLPDIDGQTVCKRIRQWSEVPIIILSASGSEERKVAALDGGADDYVTKPFGMAELEARIRTAIRHRERSGEAPASAVTVGLLDLDLVHHETHLDGASIDLTTKEFEVLSFLARHAGKTCTHQMILSAVWGAGYGSEAGYLHAYVHRLRQKLGHSGTLIRTCSRRRLQPRSGLRTEFRGDGVTMCDRHPPARKGAHRIARRSLVPDGAHRRPVNRP
jgi:two-component system KDP operon response regulator KdpE